MRCPSLSEDEPGRLRWLAQYELSAEHGLSSVDPIVEMAAALTGCPAAAVNLIGSDQVFLVSQVGIDEYEKSRDLSFCAHAINQNGVMMVDDATLDARFHDNPLVTDGFIRFYAGVPLRSPSGHALGALCVIDPNERPPLSETDQARLLELGRLVVDRLELRRLEAAAGHGAKRLEASAAHSPNAVIAFDPAGRITAWNRAAETMFGRSSAEAAGLPFDQLIAEPDRAEAHAGLDRVIDGGAPRPDGVELTGQRRSGETFPADVHLSRWHEGDQVHFGAIVRDMTEKRRERDALYRLANYDELTGLPNRNLLVSRMSEALAGQHPLGLIMTGLEGFGDINNTLGHAIGDGVVKLASGRIRDSAPPDALVARLGGAEFATLLTGERDRARTEEVARAINAALALPLVAEGHEVRMTASSGMVLAPDHGDTAAEMMSGAGLALFKAHDEGRGGTFMYVPALRAAAMARRMHHAELHRAFEQGEFELFYQPQVDLADGATLGAEALLRWRHPERGLLAPAAFLPAIESGTLAGPVGRWVVDTACAQAAAWRRLAPDFRMCVNLSAAQFADGSLPRFVSEVLATHRLAPDGLELEITENVVLDRRQAVIRQLFELREAGVRLALDDFGTGYASLNLLRRFPITHIKIDRSFIRAMHDSQEDRAIVLALIDLADQLGLEVVAEGIENTADRDFLSAHGCLKGQGFYFGKPVPAELFEEQFLVTRPLAANGRR